MTDDSIELLAAARRGVEAAWRDGHAYTKAGIMLDDLVAADLRPRILFERDVERRGRLMTARRGQRSVWPFYGRARDAGFQSQVEGAVGQQVAGMDDANR